VSRLCAARDALQDVRERASAVKETQCPRPVFQSSGLHWGTTWELHDWRLYSREEKIEHETVHQPNAPGYGNVVMIPTGVFVETWYCTKCRRVETYEAGVAFDEEVS
jgi:hypothetical protein